MTTGTRVTGALGAARGPSWGQRAFKLRDCVCVFVNGVPRPNATPEMYAPEEVESMEVYGKTYGGTGDRSGSLRLAWPSGAPCGIISGRSLRRPGRMESENGFVEYVVIWLRK